MNIQMIGKFNETFPDEKYFYSHLDMEDTTDADDAHAKKSL